MKNLTIGVLMIQGAREEHLKALAKCGVKTLAVKTKEDLEKIDGLIIPGGESTTIGKLAERDGLDKVIKEKAKKGFPIFGTCAGAILMSKRLTGPKQTNHWGLMNLKIERNAYGRQVDSFVTELSIPILGKKKFPGVFIRAPKIKQILPSTKKGSQKTEILAEYSLVSKKGKKREIVLIQEGNLLASTFHPELTSDLRLHQYFIEIVKKTFLKFH